MESIFPTIATLLFSVIIGMIGYWLKQVHKEIKDAIRQLTNYINELNKAVLMIETHINKGIEQGIKHNKERIQDLQERIEKLEEIEHKQ